jgi:hypothetical protein
MPALSRGDRERLVKLLGMLGSDHVASATMPRWRSSGSGESSA